MNGNCQKPAPTVQLMADEGMTKNVAYLLLAISFLVMMWFIVKQAKENRNVSVEDHKPKVAGSDKLSGGAKNPQQFAEPDDDALEEMAKLLGENDD